MTSLKFSSALLFIIIFLALVGPEVSGYTYDETHLELKNLPPSWSHWFGTDDLGRDLFTRVCYGGRISLFVGICAGLIDLCVGVLWGGVAALFGGTVDEVLMRVADTLHAIPYLLIVVLLMVVMGQGVFTIIIALTVTGWITMARIVRGQLLQVKQNDYVMAAYAMGATPMRVLRKHLIPNALRPIIVTLTLTIPSAIFAEAFLSFLGLGIQVPIASWGTMANEGLPALQYYPWRVFFPSLFISSTILALNLLGDALGSER